MQDLTYPMTSSLNQVGWASEKGRNCDTCDRPIHPGEEAARLLIVNPEEWKTIGLKVKPDTANRPTLYTCRSHAFICILYKVGLTIK